MDESCEAGESFDLCGGSRWLLGPIWKGQGQAGLRRKLAKFKWQKAYIKLSPFPLFSLESHRAHCLCPLVGLDSPSAESSAPALELHQEFGSSCLKHCKCQMHRAGLGQWLLGM